MTSNSFLPNDAVNCLAHKKTIICNYTQDHLGGCNETYNVPNYTRKTATYELVAYIFLSNNVGVKVETLQIFRARMSSKASFGPTTILGQVS